MPDEEVKKPVEEVVPEEEEADLFKEAFANFEKATQETVDATAEESKEEEPKEEKPPEEKPVVEAAEDKEEGEKKQKEEPVAKAPPEPAKKTLTDEEYLAKVKEQREGTLKRLVDSYNLTEEEVQQLRDEPEKVLPTLSGRLHLGVYESVMQVVRSQLPSMIQTLNVQRSVEDSVNEQFYKRWPALKDIKHNEAVKRVVDTYRRANPDSDLGKLIEDTGAIVSQQAGLPLGNGATAPAPKPRTPQPANPGTASGSPPPVSDNPFAAMYEEITSEIDE